MEMNKAIALRLAGVAVFLLSNESTASSVNIPNTFISGTPARAEEINQNFDAVKLAVDDNAAVIAQLMTRLQQLETQPVSGQPVFLKADGRNVGVVLGKSTSYTALTEQYDALSFQEYFFVVSAQTGNLVGSHTIYYSGANCTGQAYISVDQLKSMPSPRGLYTKHQGEVFGARFAGDSSAAYYVAEDTESVSITPVSAADSNTCSGGSFQHQFKQIDAYPALPNDPDITGVENSYTTPVRAGY
jgi:hypothetical protein